MLNDRNKNEILVRAVRNFTETVIFRNTLEVCNEEPGAPVRSFLIFVKSNANGIDEYETSEI